jgi:N-acetylmuramoyl-L-alanine amidase CwlA
MKIMLKFNMKYHIRDMYIPAPSARRAGEALNDVVFLVAHDTGNPNSTAMGNVMYYINSRNEQSASAHLFVDDKEIVECIPTGLINGLQKEKAWHVVYNTPIDNQMFFGYDANDVAIGVEYCYGSRINANESYCRYVWILAYLCYYYGLDPATRITGHFILDPARKSDPKSGLAASGRTFNQLIQDVVAEYNACLIPDKVLVTLNQWEYLAKLAKQEDGTGDWAKQELRVSYLSDQDNKAYETHNQVDYLYDVAKCNESSADWAKAVLADVYEFMKSKQYL